MKILVCDDDWHEINTITSMLMNCKYKDGCSIKGFHEPWSLLGYIEDGYEADAVFLDIVMPGMSGVELTKKLRAMRFEGFVVFLSSSNDFAAQSYEVKVFSYLLKPPQKHEVQFVIDKIENMRNAAKYAGIKLVWKQGGRFVPFLEIIYVEVQNHHLHFHLRNGEDLQIYGKLSDYAEILLADPRMTQENRSYILNMDYINRCENGAVFLKDGTRISIPQNFAEFQSNYLNWMFGKMECSL